MAAPLEENITDEPTNTDSRNDQIHNGQPGSIIVINDPSVYDAIVSIIRPSQVSQQAELRSTRGSTCIQNDQLPQDSLSSRPNSLNGSNLNHLNNLLSSSSSQANSRRLRVPCFRPNRIHPQHTGTRFSVEGINMQPLQSNNSAVLVERDTHSIDDDLTRLIEPTNEEGSQVIVDHNETAASNRAEDQNRDNIQEHPRSLNQNSPLRYRLDQRHRIMEYSGQADRHRQGIRCCEGFRHITLPRLKTHFKNILSYRLWRGHLKQVECHFGSSVASYFIFLRWLFYVNLLIFSLWFCVVCVPQIVLYSYHGLDRTDMTSCAYKANLNATVTCSSNWSSIPVYYKNSIHSTHSTDICLSTNETITTHLCLINSKGIAYRQNKTQILTLYSNCSGTQPPKDAYIVCYDVQTHYEWYEYILDFVTGSGIYNQTILFYGAYSFKPLGFFHFDLAFILMVGLIYILSIILLVHKMSHAYNESYSFIRRQMNQNFANKVFCAWDFNITEVQTANLRMAYNRTNFLEESSDARSRETTRSWKKTLMIYFIRFWTNISVVLLLAGAGVAIYFSTYGQLRLQRNRDMIDQISYDTVREIVILLVGYLTSIVISILNVLYPFVFGLIAKLECYKTSSTQVSMTLIRTILVRLSSLMLLLISLYEVIAQCTNVSEKYTDPSAADEYGECSLDRLLAKELFNSSQLKNYGDEVKCPDECWETYIGQQFFKLALLNGVITVGTTIFIETGRNFISVCVKRMDQEECMGRYLGKIVRRGHFNIPKSILDLIYTQTLMWLGFLFSPLLPLIVVITSVVLFYTKKISLIYNLEPDQKSFTRSAKTNFLFLLLMLFALFLSIVPVIFAATILKPSKNCGPFRGLSTMYQAVTDLIQSWPCSVQIAIDFFNSAAFVVPFITFLLLVVYGLYVQVQVNSSQYKVMTKQIQKANCR